ncbi:MAG: glycosyltransferase [Pseudomonadota bacterium]|nr:glycosyltransferase [Pseudomonadota bacterium]
MRTVLWWGRFDADYSRNRILRGLLAELGWRVVDFQPRFSGLADWEARLRRLPRPDLVWVPCFRQRDLAAASRWARAKRVPLLFDPLISAYDKQVFERAKIPSESARARRLLAWEKRLFERADAVLADTEEHARFFVETFGVAQDRVNVVYVGAEEALFRPDPSVSNHVNEALDVLFFGSFIPLQGAPVIVEAARIYQGPPVNWTLIGAGPELARCKSAAAGVPNIRFEPWLDYTALPARIRRADMLLGIFGVTLKAGRVIPNKVYQALACGKPVLTRASSAYPPALAGAGTHGLIWVEAGNPASLAEAVRRLAIDGTALKPLAVAAAETYRSHFSNAILKQQLRHAISGLDGAVGARTDQA